MKEKKALINDCTISFYDNEVVSQDTLVFIHGNSSSKDSFKEVMSHFGDYRCIALDLYGHGESDPTQNTSDYSLKGYANLLVSLIDLLDLERVVLLGHSLGGHIAIHSIPILKDKVAGLMTWGTPPLSSAEDFASAFLPHEELGILFEEEVDSARLTRFIEDGTKKNSSRQQRKKIGDDFVQTRSIARAKLGESLQRGEVDNEVNIVLQSKLRYSVIHGNNDPFISTDYANKLQSEYEMNVILEDFSHYPHCDDTIVFASLIRKILTEEIKDNIITRTIFKKDGVSFEGF